MFRLQERSGRPQGWTPKEDFKIDPCETAAAGGELAYSCKRYMGSISTERRSRNISPPAPLVDVSSLHESMVRIPSLSV